MFFHPLVLFMMMALVVSVLVLFFVVQIGIITPHSLYKKSQR